jgi:hypothetical protein
MRREGKLSKGGIDDLLRGGAASGRRQGGPIRYEECHMAEEKRGATAATGWRRDSGLRGWRVWTGGMGAPIGRPGATVRCAWVKRV